MRTEVDAPVGQPLQARWLLQAPVLATALDFTVGQAPAPVLAIPVAVEVQCQVQRLALQGHAQLLVLPGALALDGEGAELRIAGAQAVGGEVEAAALGSVEAGLERQLADQVVVVGQALAVQRQVALRCLQGARQVEAAIDLPGQPRPQLAQAAEGDIDTPGEFLLQAGIAADAVVAQAHLERTQVPALTLAAGIGLELRGLVAQAALQVDLGLQLQHTVLQAALAAQRPAEAPGQLGDPVGGVEVAQLQLRIPGQRIGEGQPQAAFRAALPGLELQRRQVHFGEVARYRAGQAEGPCRAVEFSGEVAQVAAVAVADLCRQRVQRHRRFVDGRVQAAPGEVQPVGADIGGEAVLPVEPAIEAQPLLGRSLQGQRTDIRALGIDSTFQAQGHVTALARQRRRATDLVAAGEVAHGIQQYMIEHQRIGQVGRAPEALGSDPRLGRDVVLQRLRVGAQVTVEVAAAVTFEQQVAEQVAFHVEVELPRLRAGRRQMQFAARLQRPLALELEHAGQRKREVVAAGLKLVDMQAVGFPVSAGLELMDLLAAIQQEAAQVHLAETHRQRQVDVRQADRPAARRRRARGQRQFGALDSHAVQAQGQVQQAARRPGQLRLLQAQLRLSVAPLHLLRLPVPAEAATEGFDAQPRHLRQQPAAAAFGTQ
ncbi:MAG: hypothetical protein GAK45_00496 [Pseudomonas citronellolis]|nr:MAG: hypothetical protein GAK45_00496 [Pseudomonas citronellolis]